jgi:flagellar assembly factor FliW
MERSEYTITYMTRSAILGTKESGPYMHKVCCFQNMSQYKWHATVGNLLNSDISSRPVHIYCILFMNTKVGRCTPYYKAPLILGQDIKVK